MTSKPDTVLTTMTPFRTGACESSGILLQNKGIEIAMISLTMRAKQMRAKQPKEALWLVKTDILRCIIFLEPIRLQSHTQEITCQERRLALNYEIRDMEECVSSLNGQTNIQYIQDVMDVLTKIQESWKEHE